jgi:hypothetical protein
MAKITAASNHAKVGRCKLNPVYPQLESAWFQPRAYEVKTWFQNVPSKFDLCRYAKAHLETCRLGRGGAVQLESSADPQLLKPLRFQPLNLSSEKHGFKVLTNVTCAATPRVGERVRSVHRGAVQCTT